MTGPLYEIQVNGIPVAYAVTEDWAKQISNLLAGANGEIERTTR